MINNLLDFPCPELYLEEEVDSIEQDPALVAEARPRSWLRQYYGYILSFLVGVTAIVLALVFGEGVREFENYGYVGVFLMGVIVTIPDQDIPVYFDGLVIVTSFNVASGFVPYSIKLGDIIPFN